MQSLMLHNLSGCFIFIYADLGSQNLYYYYYYQYRKPLWYLIFLWKLQWIFVFLLFRSLYWVESHKNRIYSKQNNYFVTISMSATFELRSGWIIGFPAFLYLSCCLLAAKISNSRLSQYFQYISSILIIVYIVVLPEKSGSPLMKMMHVGGNTGRATAVRQFGKRQGVNFTSHLLSCHSRV